GGVGVSSQRRVLSMLRDAGPRGLTVHEVTPHLPHHGASSAVLSALQTKGLTVRLQERREKCEVYVLPEFVQGRPRAASRAKNITARAVLLLIKGMVDEGRARG